MEIAGLTADSRQVKPGFLFAALPGSRADGRDFIGGAVERGAVAILAPPGTDPGAAVADPDRRRIAVIVDENPRRRFAFMAARFFSGQPATVAAVTGTNGKTSVVWFLRQIWAELGHRAASLGTLGLHGPDVRIAGRLTTPDAVHLHRALARLELTGVSHLAIEASSHGLAQHRLDGVRIGAAAFTNLSRDHLDYHGSADAYLAAKSRLFSDLLADGGTAVVNADAPHATDFAAIAERARPAGSDVRDKRARHPAGRDRAGRRRPAAERDHRRRNDVRPVAAGGRFPGVECPVRGRARGGHGRRAREPPWRLSGRSMACRGGCSGWRRLRNGASVYVDYAHTPDALAAVLRALRPRTRGKLVVVFGCGGDRDPGKRPEMGRIAAELADWVVVTDDNPRGEAPAEIRRQILAACASATDIGDRAEAIARVVAALAPGDVLVIAGKGHETGQTVGDRVHPFDDAEVARAVAEEVDR